MDDFRISLKAARVNADITQEQAAQHLGVTSCTIRSYESGRSSISADFLAKLAKLYEVPLERIFLPKKLD